MTTWNPADESNCTLTNGKLTCTSTAFNNGAARSTTSKTSGKWYFEITVGAFSASPEWSLGVADASYVIGGGHLLGQTDAHSAGYDSGGNLLANTGGTSITGQSTYTTGDVIGVAVDVPNHLIYWSKNGTFQNSANPAVGTGGVNYVTTTAIFAGVFENDGGGTLGVTANFGGTSFNTSPPSGFSAWDTAAGGPSLLVQQIAFM